MFRFEFGGRRIDPDKIGDAMIAAVLNSMKTDIREKVGTIRKNVRRGSSLTFYI